MARRRTPKPQDPSALDKARDELYSHILHCGVIRAAPEHQKEWFDDTLEYLTERYPSLTERQLADLRGLGERYCQPLISRDPTVGATS